MDNDILTATDIDAKKSNTDKEIDDKVKKYIKTKLIKRLAKIRKQYQDTNQPFVIDDHKDRVLREIQKEEDTENYRKFLVLEIDEKIKNYATIRSEIQELNELHVFSADIERMKMQGLNLRPYKDLIQTSADNIETYHEYCKKFHDMIAEFIASYKDRELNFKKNYDNLFNEEEPLDILIAMRKLYGLKKNMDSLELYDMYNMIDNIDMSNLLSDICFKSQENNMLNILTNNGSTEIGRIFRKDIISNKLLGILLRNTRTKNNAIIPGFPIITNNAVTCYTNTYITTKTNDRIYCTRTIGELLFDICNEDLKYSDKTERQQIYMTYDGSRPTAEEYYKWNGMQVFDIDLKEWISRGGNILKLKERMYETLIDFRWFLWICLSSSGKGIHIYTKVAPPHHIYLRNHEMNNRISRYYHMINYHTKASIIYDLIYDSRKEFGFVDSDFIDSDERSKYETGFELKYLDNSVGRITSGIRLTYDPNIMVNPHFLDMPLTMDLCHTLKGYNFKTDINNILLRQTTISKKYFEAMTDMIVDFNNEEKESKKSKVNITDYVLQGYDISKYKELPLSSIKYKVRYEVCNTLASMFGKDGLQLAHMILRSDECKNVNEINAFYGSALRNHKEATKFGLDILQNCGVVKSVEKEFNEELVDKYKLFLKKQIEKSIEVEKQEYDLVFDENDYLGNHQEQIIDMLQSDKINLIYAPPASGKCLGKDTGIIMYDGSIKKVQDIVVGDKLMGMDSTPRTVLSLARGVDEMFRITPMHGGESYTCNSAHLNSMIWSGKWTYELTEDKGPKLPPLSIIEDYDMQDYVALAEWRKHHMKLFKVPVDFPKRHVFIDPYFLGLWLGDGVKKSAAITVGPEDREVISSYLQSYADELGMKLTYYQDKRNEVRIYRLSKKYNIGVGTKYNELMETMKEYNLINNKHIPDDYLYNCRDYRLRLLAGIIDSDGYIGGCNLGISMKDERLIDQIMYLCRSLGYPTSKSYKIVNGKKYCKLSITGVFTDLPLKIERKMPSTNTSTNPLLSGFKVTPIGKGDYYGFVIDGDKRFLLSDFTVTHNTELVKNLAKEKRIMLVLPFISVIKNKIETDASIMELFDCYYDAKDISKIEYGINAVTTFDKFARANYEKISRMFDYIVIDEEHLLFNSQYRINTTSTAVKKLRQLLFISSNDPFASKIILMTGTPTGSEFFFKDNGNFIRITKKLKTKNMEFHICDDLLDTTTRLAYKVYTLIQEGYRIIIPTNKGDIYTEKMIGMVRYLLQREVKYGYYKRSNNEQEIVSKINNENTVGDYEIIFCSNYLSVGIDINDTEYPFAVLYCGNWSGFEIEQFNSRIRRQDIKSYYFIRTLDNNGKFDDFLYEEPKFQLRLTKEDIANFKDDKAVAEKKQEFIAQYDPVLHTITTPGFSSIAGQIRFNQEEYELTNFENKYSECYQHPLRVASTLAKYGYKIAVSTEFEGLSEDIQKQLKQVGIDSAKEEKMAKNDLMIGTFRDLVNLNKYVSEETALEFNNTIEYIIKNNYDIIEDREMMDCYVKVVFNPFAQPERIFVRSKQALEKMIRPAHYLIQRYSVNKCMDIVDQYIDTNGFLKKKNFMRAINLLKLIEAHGNNELSAGVEKCIEDIYDYIDKFAVDTTMKVSYAAYMNFLDNLTNNYISYLGLTIRTRYGFDKLRDSVTEIFRDIACQERCGKDLRFKYNKLPDQDSYNIINRRSVDVLIEKMFAITNDIVSESRINPKERHIELESQGF